MSDFEITALVLSEHEGFRRDFAGLEEAEIGDLGAAWNDLAARLEVHAVAEETLFYPVLAHTRDDGAAEGVHAVYDHNEIRHAVAAVCTHEVGSDTWWEAVRATQQVNADHMAEEEREFIPSFKEGTSDLQDEAREELGMRWLQFHDEHEHAQGLSGQDADPEAVVS